ncbi:MAG: molybdenum cofactor biosynthesis protein B [Robiginitomaculum sp.]|nr:molybdenum cofactor biosynthesis protein B [Robiginitomaculum sp.]
MDESKEFKPVRIAVLVVSDTRTLDDDTSGALLAERVTDAGHELADRKIVRDDIPAIRSQVKAWIDAPDVDVVISSGGTGLTGRDITPEAVTPLFEKTIEGFSHVFHMISFESVGLSTLASRAVAGTANGTFIFALPGSNNAVKDGWDGILADQLDSRNQSCNFIEIMPRLREK